jgi:hypothetical protein
MTRIGNPAPAISQQGHFGLMVSMTSKEFGIVELHAINELRSFSMIETSHIVTTSRF